MQQLNLTVSCKYFANSHGKGVVDDSGAVKARVREQVRNKGKGSIVVQSSVDFATVACKLLPNVKVIHIDEAEIQSTITKLDSWNIICETSGVSNCHSANCTGSVIKMWHNNNILSIKEHIEKDWSSRNLIWSLWTCFSFQICRGSWLIDLV